jgi:putative ABC transport system permease protein
VALSVVLLAASGLLIRSYLAIAAVEPGFSPATLTFRVGLDERYSKPEQRTAFYKRFLAKLENMHGVKYAGASNSTPLSGHESMTLAEIRGFGKSTEMIENRGVTLDHRKALGTPLLRGRDFDAHDIDAKTPVVMVNERFVHDYFKGRDPLGQQVRIGIGDLSKVPWATVIGVVGDIRHISLEQAALPQIIQPAGSGDNFAITCTIPASQAITDARAALRSLDSALTLENIRTMREREIESNKRRRFQTTLLSGFAAIAVILALAGLYGLMSYAVRQRKAEIGVRLAVGASRARVLRLVLGQGLRLTALGLLIGLAASAALTRLVNSWLFGVKATDPVTFAAVPLLIFAVAFCACVVPAWSATRIDPIEALREE